MIQRKSWSQLEDSILIEILRDSQEKGKETKVDWGKVTGELNSRLDIPRTVKQCRERWSKHLKPGLSKESEWSMSEQAAVCGLQAQHGNKWSLIAAQLPGRTDNAVKNYFYSSLRKALRKINHYITEHRNYEICRGIKVISESTIGKVVALAEGKPGRMRILAEDITQLARDIKQDLLNLWQGGIADSQIEGTIAKLLHFNRNCRRVRGPTKLNRVDKGDQSEEMQLSGSEQQASEREGSGSVSPSLEKNANSIINAFNNKPKLYPYEFCQNRKESTDDPKEDIFDQEEFCSQLVGKQTEKLGRMSMKDDCWDVSRYCSQIGNDLLLSKDYREEGRIEDSLMGRRLEINDTGIDEELEDQRDETVGKDGARTGLFNYREEDGSEVKPSILQLFREIDPEPRFTPFQHIFWGSIDNEDSFNVFSMPEEF